MLLISFQPRLLQWLTRQCLSCGLQESSQVPHLPRMSDLYELQPVSVYISAAASVVMESAAHMLLLFNSSQGRCSALQGNIYPACLQGSTVRFPMGPSAMNVSWVSNTL